MQPVTRPAFRIFISSTAVDLRDYREKVRDAVLRLEGLPIAMETFSALSGQPTSECMKMAAEADAVICIVAHRYGYVPPKELGGDGERSITWLEVDAAKREGKPVFAFLVDRNTRWPELKEQDRLTSEPQEKVTEIVKAVQKLQDFQAYLGRECVCAAFRNADELATQVTATLANFVMQPSHAPGYQARVWKPLFCHALQPAQHFRGREEKLRRLTEWLQASVTPDRVVSVVAAGGTGKTALVDKALRQATLSDRAGVFVWSFYETPDTDSFLRAAYLYFTGRERIESSGLLEHLQLVLSGDASHILVLDGLERIQSSRGELEDLRLRRLIRGLAGAVGAARSIVTSRFPLVDLDGWSNAGHRTIVLDDLELQVSLNVLRAWNVKGDDDKLAQLLEPLNMNGTYHALSVAVLGSYIGNFAQGDPTRAPEFSLEDAKESDPKARRLNRILEQYAKVLSSVERDLLARLSLFPRGMKLELLGWIAQSGGAVAGALVGLVNQQLMSHLERLKALGLVFRYESEEQMVYSAHPFLREFFRNLLGTNPESIHESLRTRLAPTLASRPARHPRDAAILNQYELLIEHTVLAGRIQGAFDLYWEGLGNYQNLGSILGDNGRGIRILEQFFTNDNFSQIDRQLTRRNLSSIVNDLGLFAQNLGDLDRAMRAFLFCRDLNSTGSDSQNESINLQNLTETELSAGHLKQALRHAEDAVRLAIASRDSAEIRDSFGCRAPVHFALGNISQAEVDFKRAAELQQYPSFNIFVIYAIEARFLRGDRSRALKQAEEIRDIAARDNWSFGLFRCEALLARFLLPDNVAKARKHLSNARAFVERSGEVELQLRCFHAACELYLHLGDHSRAIAEAEAGILLADTCGFGKSSIELRVIFAQILLAAGDFRKALESARNAFDRSEHADCQYAWGKADGLHSCGLAHLRLGEIELARQHLTAALELRKRIGHGRIKDTRRALGSLPPRAAHDHDE